MNRSEHEKLAAELASQLRASQVKIKRKTPEEYEAKIAKLAAHITELKAQTDDILAENDALRFQNRHMAATLPERDTEIAGLRAKLTEVREQAALWTEVRDTTLELVDESDAYDYLISRIGGEVLEILDAPEATLLPERDTEVAELRRHIKALENSNLIMSEALYSKQEQDTAAALPHVHENE